MVRILVLSRDADLILEDPEAEIVVRVPVGLPLDLSSPADWVLADLAVLAAGYGAADEGFDAVCIADAGDFGAAALRSVLKVPVIGAGRAAFLYALTLGARFGIAAPADLRHRMKKQVQDLGLGAQCAGLLDPGNPNSIAGADTLVLAARVQDGDLAGLPDMVRIDPAPLAVSLAVGFAALGLCHSAHSMPAPDVAMPVLVAALARAGL